MVHEKEIEGRKGKLTQLTENFKEIKDSYAAKEVSVKELKD